MHAIKIVCSHTFDFSMRWSRGGKSPQRPPNHTCPGNAVRGPQCRKLHNTRDRPDEYDVVPLYDTKCEKRWLARIKAALDPHLGFSDVPPGNSPERVNIVGKLRKNSFPSWDPILVVTLPFGKSSTVSTSENARVRRGTRMESLFLFGLLRGLRALEKGDRGGVSSPNICSRNDNFLGGCCASEPSISSRSVIFFLRDVLCVAGAAPSNGDVEVSVGGDMRGGGVAKTSSGVSSSGINLMVNERRGSRARGGCSTMA